MRLPAVGLFLASVVWISCGSGVSTANAPGDASASRTGQSPVALPDAGDCVVVLLRPSATGCLACGRTPGSRDAGHSDAGNPDGQTHDGSAIDVADGGLSCACGPENEAPMTFNQSPASCTQEGVRQFAVQVCGWSGL